MVPALQFDNWQWVSLTLASPVVVWGALPFHRAAWANLRHGAATMDTLISVGVSAAYLWSVWALLFTDAGMTGMRMPFGLLPSRADGAGDEHLPRGRRCRDHVHRGRPLLRGARQAHLGRGPAGAARHGRQGRRRAAGRPRWADRDPYAGRAARGRGPVRGPPRREDRDRRHGRQWDVRGGRLHAHGRVRPRGGRARRRRGRRDGQCRRSPGRPGHPRRLGHPAGTDGPARRGRPERQGRGPAPGRPRLGGLRADRHRPVVRDAGGVAADRALPHCSVHCRGGGPDHRLPLRPRPGHSTALLVGTGRGAQARHPHQGPSDPRVHAPCRHGGARQDRHRHHRPHGRHGHPHGRRAVRRGGAGDSRRPGGRLRAPDRPGHCQARQRDRAGLAAGGGLHRPRRQRRVGSGGRSRRHGRSSHVAGE